MTSLQIIRAYKWVKSAKRIAGVLRITTKANVLKTQLTHYLDGDEMETPIVVKLPAYVMDIEDDELVVRFLEEPSFLITTEVSVVQADPVCRVSEDEWDATDDVCLGEYQEPYEYNEDELEKVRLACEYLQVAEPEDGLYLRTRWAYNLGLVGEEVRDNS